MAKPRNVGFDKALHFLKRKHRVTRAQWKNNMALEIRTNAKGEQEVFNITPWPDGKSSAGIRHTFDQNEILANDWVVL